MRIIHYIENNPVKAQLCPRAEDWPWSSRGSARIGAGRSLRLTSERVGQAFQPDATTKRRSGFPA